MLSREQGTSEKRERGMMGTSAEREQGVMGRKRRVYFRPRFPLISSSNISEKVIASDWEQGNEYQVFQGKKEKKEPKGETAKSPLS